MVLPTAMHAARALVRGASAGRIAVVFHNDADGTSSAALATEAIERAGGETVALSPPRGENVHGPTTRDEVRRLAPRAALVLDMGSRPGPLFPGIPTAVVDHHPCAPGGCAGDARGGAPDVAVFANDPSATSTSLLTWTLFHPIADLRDRAWVAAVGVLGDAGDPRREPLLAEAARAYGLTSLRTVVALVNAAGRASSHEPRVALEALRLAATPDAIVRGETPAATRLHTLRAEVSAALQRARRVAPRVRGRWALLEIDDPCRIHGVLASTWAKRLAPRIVLVANVGYVKGRVHMAVRAHHDPRNPVDVRAALDALLPEHGPDFAAGHARASGGIVDEATYRRVLEAIEREG
jgi:hypothetical protein